MIRFYQTVFQALVDQAQDDYNTPSDGYISPTGIYEEQVTIEPSGSISQHLRTKHILWAMQRVAEKLAARRIYSEVQATMIVSNSLRQRVSIGTITIRRVRRARAIRGQGQIGSNPKDRHKIQSINLRQVTDVRDKAALGSKNYVVDLEFSFYPDGINIEVEPLFLALIRAINFFAIPRSDLIITRDIHEYDEVNDITIAFKLSRNNEYGLRYVDIINAFNACATAALRYRRYSDSLVTFKYRRVELGLLVVLKGDVPDMPPAATANAVPTIVVSSVSASPGVASS